MDSRRHVLGVAFVGAMLAPTVFAERLRSPSETLALPENRVEALVAVGGGADGRFRFRRADRPADAGEVLMRLPAGFDRALEPGSEWWVGHTTFMSVPPDPRTFAVDPEGPRVVTIEGVGPAVFPGTPPVGKVLGVAGESGGRPGDSERMTAVLDLLGAPEADLRRLAVTELALESSLWSVISEPAWEILGRAFEQAVPEPYLRFRLLEVARGAAASGGAGADRWAADWARDALAGANLQPDAATYEPALSLIALETLADRGDPSDAAEILRALRSSHPAVGRQAVFTLEKVAPAALAEAAPALLAAEDLGPEVRRVLSAVVERIPGAALGNSDGLDHNQGS